MKTSKWFLAAVAVVGLACATAGAAKADDEQVLNVASMVDFTGPYADVMPAMAGGRQAVVQWWNAEIGADLGVRIRMREYDHRYDAARVASMWPGIRSELNPVVVLGLGGPDVAALRERLPEDKVPMIMPTAAYGYAWVSDPWIFHSRATYAHEAAAFLNWYREDRGLDRPVKVGVIASEATPAYVDIARGMEQYAADNPDVAELVEVVWTGVQPADLTADVHRMVRKGAEVIQIQTNTAAVVAVKRALQAIGRPDVAIMTSSHNGLPVSGAAAGGIAEMEGEYEVYGQAVPTDDPTMAKEFFDMLVANYDVSAGWNVATVMGLNQTLVAVRAIEAAVAEHGAENVTGEMIREMMFAKEFSTEELSGVLPNLDFSRDAPFPRPARLTVNIATVRDGQYTIAEQGYPVPTTVNKW